MKKGASFHHLSSQKISSSKGRPILLYIKNSLAFSRLNTQKIFKFNLKIWILVFRYLLLKKTSTKAISNYSICEIGILINYAASIGDYISYFHLRKQYLEIEGKPWKMFSIDFKNQLKSYQKINKRLQEIVKGKTISILAPLDRVSSTITCDLEVRFNALERYNKRDCLTYFNRSMLDIYLAKTEKPKFDVIRIFRTDFNCPKGTNITHVNSLPPTRRLLPNMLPRAIWDLYIHGSKQILAVDFDLFLTKKRKDGYIPANTKYAEKFKNWENRFRVDSINGHDPFTQFEILKLMWDKGMFEPIGRTKEVLSMGLEEFAKQLSEVYKREK